MAPPNEIFEIEDALHHSCTPVANVEKDRPSFDLKALIDSIHGVLGEDKGLDSSSIDAQKIIRLMEKYSSNSDDWSQYTLFDHSRAYTRNLIDDGNGKFNLMILAWSKGQRSPIHDHAGSHCVMKILDGELQETLFDWPNESSLSEPSSDFESSVSCTAVATAVAANDITEATSDACEESTEIACKQQPLKVFKDTIYKRSNFTLLQIKTKSVFIVFPTLTRRKARYLSIYTHRPTKSVKLLKRLRGKQGAVAFALSILSGEIVFEGASFCHTTVMFFRFLLLVCISINKDIK